ncbi:phage tail tube protein [Eoetvoesiella caeni]|uniref:Phage tail tube protein n=1 Tax=Eoetvoesiella caeni TaxID=645616 RepID=A0A366HBG4_9BURK|nr:phage tail tube protein [Eoetvoesiella caeni]MCI2809391.1 phage tail tube protein [Eoetvoesiella caeni]NYT54532.1 Ig-like domain-containing protein [Eoetvoesiella caeni]RBP39278.1 phage tail tube protein [Eoetvoesiella caeni]
MACNKTKYTGRDVVLEYFIGCGDALPAEADWKRFGSMRTKEFTLEWETADGTADDSVGALRENLATFQSLSISGDGTLKASGSGSANLIEMTKHVANPTATGGEPVAWMRMTFPDLTFVAFMLVTNMSRSAPYDDVATYSLEASATASDFGLIVTDTPDPDAPAVTSVEVVPATLAMTVGETYDLESVVLPTNANQGVTWSSSVPAEVSVNAVTGAVEALTATTTTATITATSTDDPTKTDSCVVTVS